MPAPHLPTGAQDHARILERVEALYRETDVPPPSLAYPITPLGPILELLPVVCRELPGLTSRVAEAYLLRRGSLNASFPAELSNDEMLSGFLCAGSDQSFVFLRGEDPVVRRRFSLSHELGHLVLHLPGWLEGGMEPDAEFHDLFTERQADSGGTVDAGADPLSVREWQADTFAAELLMPMAVVRAVASEALRQGFFGIGLAERVANQMLVSRAAMWRRLMNLGLTAAPRDADVPTILGPAE